MRASLSLCYFSCLAAQRACFWRTPLKTPPPSKKHSQQNPTYTKNKTPPPPTKTPKHKLRGHSFFSTNAELLDLYAECADAGEVIAAQTAYLERCTAAAGAAKLAAWPDSEEEEGEEAEEGEEGEEEEDDEEEEEEEEGGQGAAAADDDGVDAAAAQLERAEL